MQILCCAVVFSCYLWAAVSQNRDGENAAGVGDGKNLWDEPIQFVTKTNDKCSMMVTGHEELTRLRISCTGQEASYWCEYEGKPDICRSYNNNPRHFFTQIMWDLRKLKNACQGPQNLKPIMCKRASDESKMVFTTGSLGSVEEPQTTLATAAKQDQHELEQAKPQPRASAIHSDQAKPNGPRQISTRQKPAKPEATRPPAARSAKAKTEQVKAESAKTAASKPGTKTTTLKKVLIPKAATPAPTTTTPPPTGSAEILAQQYCWHSMQDLCTQVISWFTE